jgi:hypothetical protein
LQGIEDWQHRRRQEMARVTFDASQHEMLDANLSGSNDRGVGLRRTLSFLEIIRDQIKQRTFRSRQYSELESLYQGVTGWRQALIFGLMHRFSDPLYLNAQQADEEERQSLRKIDFDCEPPGEPEYQELLRLLDEEIAGVREEFEYAEKANEERVAIEREACLAPEGETWSMMLRQEGALDRSIDRKVRILMRLRKELPDLPTAPASQDDGARMGNDEEATDIDIVSHTSQGEETLEDAKLKERRGNVYENKGPAFPTYDRSANIIENNGSYADNPGILLNERQLANVPHHEWTLQGGCPMGGGGETGVVGKAM